MYGREARTFWLALTVAFLGMAPAQGQDGEPSSAPAASSPKRKESAPEPVRPAEPADEDVIDVPGVLPGAKEPFLQPYANERIERGQLDAEGARTLTDNLQYRPGVVIQHTAPNQASPFVRGLTGEQTLLLFDQVRFSHAMMRPGPNQYAAMIPDESVGSIDVILGSVSAVAGSDSLTGALDFRLARPGRDAQTPASFFINGRASSAEGFSTSLGMDGISGHWAYSFEAGVARHHDLVGGRDQDERLFRLTQSGSIQIARAGEEIPNTAYDQFNFGARAAFTGLRNNRFELAVGQSRQVDAPRPDGYFENSGKSSRISRFFDPQTFTYAHLRHVLEPETRAAERLQTTLWWHQHFEYQIREDIKDSGTASERYRRRAFDDRLDAFGIDVQSTSRIRGAHEIVYGVTAIAERTSNAYLEHRSPVGVLDPVPATFHNADADRTSVPDGASYDSLGLFVQTNLKLHAAFDLLAGVRYSRYAWDADVTNRQGFVENGIRRVKGDMDNVTGNLRASLQLGGNMMAFAGVSQGFRAPNLRNLSGRVDRGSSNQVVVGNPDLEAEKSLNTEIGWRYKRDANTLSVSLFRTAIDELIQPVFTDTNGDMVIDANDQGRVVNAEDGLIYGAELSADVGITLGKGHRIALVTTASQVRATAHVPQEDGTVAKEFISRANRTFGTTGVKFMAAGRWWLMPRLRWSARYDDASPSDANDPRMTVAGTPAGEMPGFGVFDIRAGWQNDAGTRRITVGFENVFNKTYRDPGSGTDGPGLSLVVSGGVRF